MIRLNDNYMRLAGNMLNYIYEIVDRALENDLKLILWGYGRGGRFIRHLIQDYDGRIQVEYIIDQKIRIPEDAFFTIYRSTVLNYLESKKYLILSTIKDISQILPIVSEYGYELGDNLFDVRDDIGDSYLEFFEKKNSKINFEIVYKQECNEYGLECNEHVPFGYSCADSVFSLIASLNSNLAFFDFGCGKGAAILMAYLHGIKKIGGVELVPEIYQQAKVNLQELRVDCELINGDATICNIDDYNCFFLYNPFIGEIFKRVIINIENSFIKNPRHIYLVYGNPFEHKRVIEDGYFKLMKQIRTDLYDPLMNIYEIVSDNNG